MRHTRKTRVTKLTFLSTFSRTEVSYIPFPIISEKKNGMAEVRLSFISENAEIICWTTHI